MIPNTKNFDSFKAGKTLNINTNAKIDSNTEKRIKILISWIFDAPNEVNGINSQDQRGW